MKKDWKWGIAEKATIKYPYIDCWPDNDNFWNYHLVLQEGFSIKISSDVSEKDCLEAGEILAGYKA